MSTLDTPFLAAAAVARLPAWRKLVRPGVGKFLKRRWARSRGAATPVETRLFSGDRMTVVLPEVISEALYTYGLFDETVTWLLLQSVQPGETVLDVGAHFGYFSLLLSRLVGPGGRVYSFEPTPSTFEVLAANAARAGNITPVHSAAGDSAGTLEIADYGLKYCAWNTLAPASRMPDVLDRIEARRERVVTLRLDDFIAERSLSPAFIKIDAENFERQVIGGLLQTVSRGRPAILMETGSAESLSAGALLLERGYGMWVSDGPRSLYRWEGRPDEANAKFKDILFRHSSKSAREETR